MAQLFALGAESLLKAPLAMGGTALLVDAALADLFPVANTDLNAVPTVGLDWFKLVIEDALGRKEVVYARTRALGNANILNLLRGQEGTTARDYTADNTVVRLSYTAQDLQAAIELASSATGAGKSMLSAADAAAQRTLLSVITAAAAAAAADTRVQNQSATAFLTAGTLSAYTLTPAPAIAAYAANQRFNVRLHVTNGASPTIDINGKGPVNMKVLDGTNAKLAPLAGSLSTNIAYDAIYDGTDVVLMNALYVRPSSGRRQTVSSCAVGGESATVTITNATPGVVTHTAHGKEANTPYSLATTGGLPTGLTAATTYYISATGLTANTFQLSATPGGASIATSSAGSGVHTGTFGEAGSNAQPILGGLLGGTGFTTSNINAANPLYATIANGFDANGPVDLVTKNIANMSWTGMNTNGTWGIFADGAVGTLSAVNGCLPLPKYPTSGNFDTTSNQFTFRRDLFVGKVGNGATAAQTNRICLGEVTVAGGVITSIIWYATNRFAESPVTVGIPGASSKTNFNHRLGVTPLAARAKFIVNTANNGFAIDDVVPQVMSRDASGYVLPLQPTVNRTAMFLSAANGNFYVTPAAGGLSADITASASYSFTQIADGGW